MKKVLPIAYMTAVVATVGVTLAGGTASASTSPPMDKKTNVTANERNGSFDLQAHRGGRGEWTEESLAAFANSLELGVTTLELDAHLTADEKVIVWHDDVMTATKCADTVPAFEGDVEYPYAGDRVRELSLAQIQTMDCGYQQLSGYPEQENIVGNRVAELSDVYDLAKEYKAKKVRFNVETKVETPGPEGAVEMAALTRGVLAEIVSSGLQSRTSVQSFDWASLNLVKELEPDLELVALSSGDAWLGIGEPGITPNLGGIDIDDYGGSLAFAAAKLGYDAISPIYSSVTPRMISEAHQRGLLVVPWTVNTAADMNRLMDAGVDGIITDYPTRLRSIMDNRDQKLPKQYHLK